jgi:ribosomal protein S6
MAGSNSDIFHRIDDSDALQDYLTQAVYDAVLLLQPLQNNIAYARDINDQMRVIVSNQANVTVAATNFWNNGTYVGYYGASSVTSVDPREQLELQSQANINSAINRWTIT